MCYLPLFGPFWHTEIICGVCWVQICCECFLRLRIAGGVRSALATRGVRLDNTPWKGFRFQRGVPSKQVGCAVMRNLPQWKSTDKYGTWSRYGWKRTYFTHKFWALYLACLDVLPSYTACTPEHTHCNTIRVGPFPVHFRTEPLSIGGPAVTFPPIQTVCKIWLWFRKPPIRSSWSRLRFFLRDPGSLPGLDFWVPSTFIYSCPNLIHIQSKDQMLQNLNWFLP